MASENKTVAEIVSEMRERCIDEKHSPSLWPYLDSIEAAHKREVAELEKKCEEYERQPELMADTAKAALELLKAQDSKIAELCECLKEACSLQLRCDSCKIRKCDSICAMKLKWHKAMEGVPK